MKKDRPPRFVPPRCQGFLSAALQGELRRFPSLASLSLSLSLPFFIFQWSTLDLDLIGFRLTLLFEKLIDQENLYTSSLVGKLTMKYRKQLCRRKYDPKS